MGRTFPFLIFCVIVLSLSCTNDTATAAHESFPLKSAEFKAMQASYKIYHDYMVNGLKDDREAIRSKKMTFKEYFEAKKVYREKLRELLTDVGEKRKLFIARYPKAHDGMDASEILEQLKESTIVSSP